jgi:electron transfer flavoprotein beta subunit
MMIAVCVKWVDGLAEPGDDRFAGISAADQAALELALQHAAATNDDVVVVALGPAAAERALRDALACGATSAIRVDADTASPSDVVAGMIADVVRDAAWVWCGDYSTDRGTGSMPAFLADRLGWPQALGAVGAQLGSELRITRRLDGGRRELLTVVGPAVVSVEGSVCDLRRAPLAALLRSKSADVSVVARTTAEIADPSSAATVRPYRPRARSMPAPIGDHPLDRLRALTAAGATAASRGETLTLPPREAAERIVVALRDWGYLADS